MATPRHPSSARHADRRLRGDRVLRAGVSRPEVRRGLDERLVRRRWDGRRMGDHLRGVGRAACWWSSGDSSAPGRASREHSTMLDGARDFEDGRISHIDLREYATTAPLYDWTGTSALGRLSIRTSRPGRVLTGTSRVLSTGRRPLGCCYSASHGVVPTARTRSDSAIGRLTALARAVRESGQRRQRLPVRARCTVYGQRCLSPRVYSRSDHESRSHEAAFTVNVARAGSRQPIALDTHLMFSHS